MFVRFLSTAFLATLLVVLPPSEGRPKPCSVPGIRKKNGDEMKVVMVNAGQDARLVCTIKNSGVLAYWMKDNKTLHSVDDLRIRVKINKYLKIKKVGKGDAGRYTCVAENDCGRNTYTIQLLVNSLTNNPDLSIRPAAPVFTVPPRKLERYLLAFPVGYSVKLDCSADGHPRPTVTWYKDGAVFTHRQGGSRLYLDKHTLVLSMRDLVPSDTGKYTCNVSNAHGWINHTYYMDIHVSARAAPVVVPMENVTVYEGENATLVCKALSDSMPHFQFLRWFERNPSNGSTNSSIEHPYYEVIRQNEHDSNQQLVLPHSDDRFFHGVKLTLVNVTKEDEGKYSCIVGNTVGYAVEQAYVIVNNEYM